MVKILVTGSSGFLGRGLYAELKAQGHIVYGLSRHGQDLVGDITQPGLGLKDVPKGIHSVYHLAAIHRLGKDKDGSIWETNGITYKAASPINGGTDFSKLPFSITKFARKGGASKKVIPVSGASKSTLIRNT